MNQRRNTAAVAIALCVVALAVITPPVARAEWSQDYDVSLEDGKIICVALYNGDIVAGGLFTAINGVPLASVALWDGQVWNPLGAGITYEGGTGLVEQLLVYDGRLVAAGIFDQAGSVATNGIAYWDGRNWQAMGGGIGLPFSGDYPSVKALMIYDGGLIAGGDFVQIGGLTTNNVGRWDGRMWHAFGSGAPEAVHCFTEYQDYLYAGGTSTDFDPEFGEAVWFWTGSHWGDAARVGVGWWVYALIEYDGDLIAGGEIFFTNGNLAVKNGNYWEPYAGGVYQGGGSILSRVHDLDVFDGDLIVSGRFDHVGDPTSLLAWNVARWDGANWGHLDHGVLGQGPVSNVDNVVVDRNRFFAAGNFTKAGPYPMESLVTWTEIAIDDDPVNTVFSEISGGDDGVSRAALDQNYPNPFNPRTIIRYSIAREGRVTLAVYDVTGALVKTLVNDTLLPDAYTVEWDGTNNAGRSVSSGAYYYRLTTERFTETRKMLLLK